MKKIFSFALVLALAFSFVAPAATNAEATTYTRNLTIGERGGAVTQLQLFLQARGFFPATQAATGYFGPITRTAVAAYQTSKGITPAVGYFGPITRAAVMAEEGNTIPAPTPVTPGCPAGALFNSMTGAPCTAPTTPTTPGLTGVEGVVDVLLAPTPSNNSSVQTNIDVPVYGIEFRGKIAPVAVQTIDLEVDVALASAPTTKENPATLINTIKIWDGSTVLATVPVNMSTFIRDSANKYYVRISGINSVVAANTTKTLTVSFSTNYIDTSRNVAVSTYGSSAIRAVSGNGISTFYSLTNATRNHVFQKPGNSSLTVSSAATQLRSKNTRLNTSSMTYADATLFNVKSESGDSKVTTVVATSSVTGFAASNLVYDLYDGSTIVDSKTGSSTVTFSNLNIAVAKDQTKTLKVVVGFPASTTASAVGTVAVTIDSVSYDNANGSNTSVDAYVAGAAQYAYGQSAGLTLSAVPTLVAVKNDPATTTTMTATFKIKAMPKGGDFDLSAASSTILFVTSTGSVVEAVAASIVRTDNSSSDIPDGDETVTLEVSAVLSSTDAQVVSGAAQYRAIISGFDWTVGANQVDQIHGFEDYVTNLVTVTK